MLDARKDAAPVGAVDCLVNHLTDFDINSVPSKYFVIYSSQQFQDETSIVDVRSRMRTRPSERVRLFRKSVFVASPSFGLVLTHLLAMPFTLHLAPPTRTH